VAEWWLRSRRVESALKNGRLKPPAHVELTITVPVEIYAWKVSPHDRSHAIEVQLRNRDLFLQAFAKGLIVLGYERDASGSGTYLLGRRDEQFSLEPQQC
jgi:hypothetical protein